MVNGMIIAAICANSAFVPSNVCNSTSEAVSKQVGAYQNVDLAEEKVREKVLNVTPNFVKNTVGYGAAIYRLSTGNDARIGFKIPNFCDRLELGGSKKSGSFNVRWNF